jgi:ABC-2 type transport system ATP-binding protein
MQKTLVQLHHVNKYYPLPGGKRRHALKNVSLDIYRGETLGLLGVNGAGKTTLSSLLATQHPATSGQILYNGQSIYDNLAAYRSIIGYCPQKPNVDEALTLRQNLYFAGLFYGLDEQTIAQRIRELAKQFVLEEYLDASISTLSGGYRQRFMLARSLMHNPQLVLLDEPTVGLDPHIRRQLWQCITDLKEHGVTVILTTHYLDEAEQLSDRVCILDKGSIIHIDTPANLIKHRAKKNLEEVFLSLIEEVEKERCPVQD